MPRSKTPTHIVEFPLRASKRQLRQVAVRLRAAGNLYNAILGEGLRRLEALRADPALETGLAALKAARRSKDDAAIKACRNALSDLDKVHGFTDYDQQALATRHKNACWIKDHLDAHSAQTVASRAFRALNAYRFGKRGRPRFKTWRNAMSSVEGKAKSCLVIRIGNGQKPTRFCWKGLEIPLVLDPSDPHGYEAHALSAIAAGGVEILPGCAAGCAR